MMKRLIKVAPPLRCIRIKAGLKEHEDVIKACSAFPTLRILEICYREEKLDVNHLVDLARRALRAAADYKPARKTQKSSGNPSSMVRSLSEPRDTYPDPKVVRVIYYPEATFLPAHFIPLRVVDQYDFGFIIWSHPIPISADKSERQRAQVTGLRASNNTVPIQATSAAATLGSDYAFRRNMTEFQLLNENQKLQNVDTYSIPNELDVGSMDERGITKALEGAVEAVADNHEMIADPEVFDVYRSLLKHTERLAGLHLSKMLDSLLSGFQAEAEAASRDIDADDHDMFSQHRTALEMYAFLLHWFCVAADKGSSKTDDAAAAPVAAKPKRGKGKTTVKRNASARTESWTWADHVPQTLSAIAKILRIKSGRLWVSSGEKRAFVDTLTRPAYTITESEAFMKDEATRMGVYKVICVAVKHHDHASSAQVLILQCIQLHEHLAEPMAEVLSVLGQEFDYPQLTEAVLRDISNKTFGAQDTKTPRSFSKFLVRLTNEVPRLVLKQLSLVQTHMDSESYTMRMGLVEIFGLLIKEVTEDDSYQQEQKEKLLNRLFDTLISRFLDTTTYVRARLLATLTKLCDLPNKFPAQRLRITQAVLNTLLDRASTVRRNAVVLLTKLILTHPYALIHGGPLNREEWEAGYDKVNKDLQALGTKEMERIEAEATDERKDDDERMEVDGEEEEDAEEEDEDDEDEDGEPKPRKKKSKKVKSEPQRESDAVDLATITEEQLDGNNIMRLKFTKKYYADALNFIRHVESAMETVGEMLSSTYKAETLEAIEFFRVAHEYKFVAAQTGIRQMLHLIWSKDTGGTTDDEKEVKGIRLRLIECYRSLYFEPVSGLDPKSQINRIAKNMIDLTYDSTVAELTSLEELMRTMAEDNQIHPDVINKLWQVYSADRDIPRTQRRGAIVILGMIAVAKRQVVTERIDTLLNVGLGPLGKSDLVLARYTCVALQRVSGSHKKVKGSLVDKSTRLPMDNPIFTRLQEAIAHPSSSKEWFGMAEQAINAIYQLGEQPDILCSQLIKAFTRRAFTAQPPPQPVDEDVDMEDGDATATERRSRAGSVASAVPDTQASAANGTKPGDVGNSFHLSQLVFLVGHVALKHIVHLELVEREWKRRKEEAAKAEQKPSKGPKQDDIEQVAGNAEDEIGDTIHAIREKELLYGEDSLLAVYGPMIVHICGTPKAFKNQTLRTAATLALSKLMCVSSQFCEGNLMLLFKIMETSRNPVIKSNIVIALGDVAICFNNMIDENSNRLYDGLTDQNLTVKKNTLMVLTHLILNGMIKVKGQLGEMAKCLQDEDKRIADLAKLFFGELSTKDNAIYNNLPDVISHLSVGEHSVPEDAFQSTMQYIFKFIEKEKQAETIVEKLCQRFRVAAEERQWRDIAFCLSMLPYKSERSVKKLIEGLPFYQDKLHEETVFQRFNDILVKARSNKSANKPDTELDEFERILLEHKDQGEQDNELAKRTEHNVAAAQKRASRRSARKRRKSTQDGDD